MVLGFYNIYSWLTLLAHHTTIQLEIKSKKPPSNRIIQTEATMVQNRQMFLDEDECH